MIFTFLLFGSVEAINPAESLAVEKTHENTNGLQVSGEQTMDQMKRLFCSAYKSVGLTRNAIVINLENEIKGILFEIQRRNLEILYQNRGWKSQKDRASENLKHLSEAGSSSQPSVLEMIRNSTSLTPDELERLIRIGNVLQSELKSHSELLENLQQELEAVNTQANHLFSTSFNCANYQETGHVATSATATGLADKPRATAQQHAKNLRGNLNELEFVKFVSAMDSNFESTKFYENEFTLTKEYQKLIVHFRDFKFLPGFNILLGNVQTNEQQTLFSEVFSNKILQKQVEEQPDSKFAIKFLKLKSDLEILNKFHELIKLSSSQQTENTENELNGLIADIQKMDLFVPRPEFTNQLGKIKQKIS